MRKSFSFVVTHDDEELVVFGLFDPVDDTNVWMIQRGSGASLAEQALFVPVAHSEVIRQEFQGDHALKLQVERLIHHTHAAGA